MRGIARILMIAVLASFAAGCAGDVEDVIDELERRTDRYIFGLLYEDCGTPVLTNREPLPEGDHPQSWVTEGDSFWDCNDTEERYNADGSFSRTFTDRTIEYSDLENLHQFCREGDRPPRNCCNWKIDGSWVVADGEICTRFDENSPGIITCSEIVSEPDGQRLMMRNLKTIQDGQEQRERARDINCSLVEP